MPQAQSVYLNPEELLEDFDMTFQTALLGTDGMVLASDRLLVERGLRGLVKSRTPYERTVGKKIHISEEKSVICAYAGGPYSEAIARRIVTDCDPRGLSDIAWRNCLENATKLVTEYEDNTADEILVLRCDNTSALKLIRQRNDDPTFTPVTSQMCSGIDSDAKAIPRFFWHANANMRELCTLALVTIDYAHQEFPGHVGGGADVVKIDKRGNLSEKSFTLEELAQTRSAFTDRVRQALPW